MKDRLLRSFAQLPLSRKIFGLALFTATIGLVLSLVIAGANTHLRESRELDEKLKGLSGLIAQNVSAAVAFKDHKAIDQVLASLRVIDEVRQAWVEDAGGARISQWAASADPAEAAALVEDGRRHREPIVANGAPVATLTMVADTRHLRQSLIADAVIVAGCALLAFGLLYALVIRWSLSMTIPLTNLAEATQRVGRTGNFADRVARESDDEVGRLIDSFNLMLEQIENRDRALQRQKGQLEDEVERRTAELRHAKERAEAASEAKTRFLATMSHEIRTPMNGVLGMTELLLKANLNERQQRLAQTIETSGKTLMFVINDILDFSRVEAGHVRLEEAPFSPLQVAEDAAKLFANAADAKDVRIECVATAGVEVELIGDAHRFRQVLTNLVGNAVKFTERGFVEVELRWLKMPPTDGPGRLRIAVSDTGIGISSEARARLFQPFEQADGSMARRFGGTGLGLAIACRLATLMGGEIHVDSAPGRGSVFAFEVPLRLAPGARIEPAQPLAGRRVLVVQLNGEPTSTAVRHLEALGAQTRLARTADAVDAERASPASDLLVLAAGEEPPSEMLNAAARLVRAHAAAGVQSALLIRTSMDEHAGWIGCLGSTAVLRRPVSRKTLLDAVCSPPTQPAPTAAAAAPIVPTPMPAPAIAAPAALRVLLVEDNPVNQLLASEFLQVVGASVTLVENGLDAIAAVKARSFDVVLMDWQLPDLDGLEATRRIRAWEQETARPPLPIVAITANAMTGDRAQCLAAGADDYVPKPYRIEQLEAVLTRVLADRSDA